MSDLAHALGRVCLAVIFIIAGYGKLMAVAGIAKTLRDKGFPQPVAFGYAVGALELVGGVLILIGLRTRWVALVMLLFTAGTILVSHAFWTMEGAQYLTQRTQALKNLAIMGGFLLLFAHGGGALSVDGRKG